MRCFRAAAATSCHITQCLNFAKIRRLLSAARESYVISSSAKSNLKQLYCRILMGHLLCLAIPRAVHRRL